MGADTRENKEFIDQIIDAVREEYPELEKEDFQAVYSYVADLVDEEQVFPVESSV